MAGADDGDPPDGAGGESWATDAQVAAAKAVLRARLLPARAKRPAEELARAATLLANRVLALPAVQAAATVAAYASATHEPGTWPLLDELHSGGVRILLPVVLPDLDLDWADYDAANWTVGRFGIREPAGARLGTDALTAADVVICPGLAGDPAGNRLGKGGGSFDRALARLSPGVPRLLLLYDDEVLAAVPTTPFDQPVDVLVSPNAGAITTVAYDRRVSRGPTDAGAAHPGRPPAPPAG